ncbi:ABC transporter ATP-binding protein [Streptococcaceae bacterium ESL0687]|nr:ABC transporter ATP-binding protein [Streptococcaceae bacterium ESL0687]
MKDEILKAQNLDLSYQKKKIINSLDVNFLKNKITVIVGPNGCGKSTLLKGLGRIIDHKKGHIYLNKQNLAAMTSKEIARELAFLSQESNCPEDVTVRELVSVGRYPHQGIFQKSSPEDERIIDEVLADTGLTELAHENINFLSGGQKQRVWIAMALAQKTPLILLDEPTTYLDMGHQIELLNLIHDLKEKNDLTVIMVLHDLNLAARYADHMIGMKDGQIMYEGSPQQLMTEEILKELFNVKVHLGQDPVDGKPICLRFEQIHD